MDSLEKIISEFILKKKTENDAFNKLLTAMKNQLEEVEKLNDSSVDDSYSTKSKKSNNN